MLRCSLLHSEAVCYRTPLRMVRTYVDLDVSRPGGQAPLSGMRRGTPSGFYNGCLGLGFLCWPPGKYHMDMLPEVRYGLQVQCGFRVSCSLDHRVMWAYRLAEDSVLGTVMEISTDEIVRLGVCSRWTDGDAPSSIGIGVRLSMLSGQFGVHASELLL